jgi:N-acetyl-gamma-glutamyl-phosphate reductase
MVAARDNAGRRLGDVLPATEGVAGFGDRVIEAFDPELAESAADRFVVAFCALPHGASARVCAALYAAGVTVVDLSADFRLHDLATFETWYGSHPASDLLPSAIYGLVELHRERLLGARLIAAPGCYPTSAILPLAPLLSERLVETSGLIVDSKSGVSGAGRTPKPSTHLPETAEGIRPYNVAGKHRHTPEIEQELSEVAGERIVLTFTPQLAPFSRGILTCAYAKARPGTTVVGCRDAARSAYEGGLVTVLDGDRLPDTLWVRGSARAHVAYALDSRTETVLSFCAIDNLARGASAQAIQALNASLGWPDALGLPEIALFP